MVPGRKFSSTTSALLTSFRRMACPSGAFMLRVRLFLLRFTARKYVASPPTKGGQPRVSSPLAGSSTLITSAPMSPRNMEPKGPARMRVKSMTRTPARGGRQRAGRGDFFLALFTWHPFPETLDEALADGRHLLSAIPRPPPDQACAVGKSQVGEVEDRVDIFHGHARSDPDPSGLLAVAEQARPALELHDGDVQR